MKFFVHPKEDSDEEDEDEDDEEEKDQKVPTVQLQAPARYKAPELPWLLGIFRSRKISLGQPMHPPTLGEIISLQKPVPEKRRQPIVPPAVTAIKNGIALYNNMPCWHIIMF